MNSRPSMRPPAGLDQPFSLYLDLVRTLAALAVVAAHFGYFGIFSARQVAAIPDFGREAVIAFFVLSGFVIAYSAEHKNHTLGEYAAARCARLYSVALPVLLFAFLLAALAAGPLHGRVDDAYQLQRPWLYVPFHLLFLGDVWRFAERPPWLLPYWSLDYEAWYYVLFGVACYLRGRRRLLALACVLALIGPRLWLLLPVWLSGVALYRWQRRPHAIGRGAARAGWLLSVLLMALWGWLDPEPALRQVANGAWPFTAIRLGSADRVLADYAVMLIVLANFACARHAGFGLLERLRSPVRRMSAHTFTLYLSHGVVIGAWQTLVPIERGQPGTILALAAAIALVTVALQPLTVALQRALHAGVMAFAGVLGRVPRVVQ
ncbi:acyltransferase family protein [Massilia forsythiae]|uniref:Acyltransferase family protein n=1 Tax=Massilia forsythiae TaxID=2728020 RepID=A0A7Z2ZTC3_9BURK|nr:acyltransferase family protein [Massilia forsythiae]QJE01438.1 acyltransferase family protein [Massilia forsythiae]